MIGEIGDSQDHHEEKNRRTLCHAIDSRDSDDCSEKIDPETDICPFLDASLDHGEQENYPSKSLCSFEFPTKPVSSDAQVMKHLD